jgi:hypothetical protein
MASLFFNVDVTNHNFLLWLIGLPLSYIFFALIFRGMNWWKFSTRKGSRASDIMAFEIVAGFSVLYLGSAGLVGHFNFLENDISQLQLTGFYGRSRFVENHLLYPMFCFQSWNLILCLINGKDLYDPTMLVHHALTALAAGAGLYPFMQQYATFFIGLVELSGIPLTFIDVFKYFPGLARRYPLVNSLSRSSFAVLFLTLRVVLYPVYCYRLSVELLQLLRSGGAHSTGVVCIFLLEIIFFVLLQQYWGWKVVKSIFRNKSSSSTTSD